MDLSGFSPGTRRVSMADMKSGEAPLPVLGGLIDANTGKPLEWADVKKAPAAAIAPPEPFSADRAQDPKGTGNGAPEPVQAPVPTRSPEPRPDADRRTAAAKSFVTLRMRGAFGCFEAYARDFVECATHFLLLYNSEGGDGRPRFEPPIDQPFTLEVLMSNGEFKAWSAVHLGLVTAVPNVGWIVVFIRASDSGDSQ